MTALFYFIRLVVLGGRWKLISYGHDIRVTSSTYFIRGSLKVSISFILI